jgi:hypothetical protein
LRPPYSDPCRVVMALWPPKRRPPRSPYRWAPGLWV